MAADNSVSAGGLSIAVAHADADRFPLAAQQRQFHGLTFEAEGKWNGPFTFLQAADTQFGMMFSFSGSQAPPNATGSQGEEKKEKEGEARWHQEVALTARLVRGANAMRPRPRFLVVCGDLVDAMPGVPCRQEQVRDFKAVLSALHPDIKPVCVCGNHDIGDSPTADSIAQYCRDFGDDYFAFWCGGVKFLAVNSQFYHDDSKVRQLSEQQHDWLKRELADTRPRKHFVGFQEEPVDIFGVTTLSFNFANKQRRYAYLDQLKTAGMTKLFCGHYHRNAGGVDETLEVVVTSAVGCQLGDDAHGVRVVRVSEESIEHEYVALVDLPE